MTQTAKCSCGARVPVRDPDEAVPCPKCGEWVRASRPPSPDDCLLLAFARPQDDDSIVDFITWGFVPGVQAWRAKLQGRYVLIISGGVLVQDQLAFAQVADRLVVPAKEFVIEPQGKASLLWWGTAVTRGGMTVKARFTFHDRHTAGVLSPTCLARYEAWKRVTSSAGGP